MKRWFRDTYAEAVWASEALRPNEKLVALTYADHAGDPEKPTNDVAWVSWPRLSERTGIRSKDALNRAVRRLEAMGWLVLVERRKQHKSPRYRLVVPDRPDVRFAVAWAGPEVRETGDRPVDNPTSEVRETDVWEGSEVRPTDHSDTPEVRETTPEVRETAPRGTGNGPDLSTDLSTTDNPGTESSNHKMPAKPACKHKWTADGDCLHCERFEPCPDCRRLARYGDTTRCYQHQDHQEAS